MRVHTWASPSCDCTVSLWSSGIEKVILDVIRQWGKGVFHLVPGQGTAYRWPFRTLLSLIRSRIGWKDLSAVWYVQVRKSAWLAIKLNVCCLKIKRPGCITSVKSRGFVVSRMLRCVVIPVIDHSCNVHGTKGIRMIRTQHLIAIPDDPCAYPRGVGVSSPLPISFPEVV